MPKPFQFALIVLLASVMSGCSTYIGRWATLAGPDTEDYKKLPTREIAGAVTPVPMPRKIEQDWMRRAPFRYGETNIDNTNSFDSLLSGQASNAFILIADGVIVDERYYNGTTRESLFKSFSMSKSFFSALLGIATEDGFIAADDRLDKHVSGIENPALAAMQLSHLLDNVSGFRYERGVAPWKHQPRMYYTTDARRYLMSAEVVKTPGSAYHGEDLSPLWLGAALEKALQKRDPNTTLSAYFATRLWQPMGAEYSALWVLDREDDGLEKIESGLVARPLDLARLGQLFLDDGVAYGKQVVPRQWVRSSVSAPGLGKPNHFKEGFHRNLWWGAFRPNRKRDDFYANGHFGQRIYVCPDKRLVLVRLGTDSGTIDWTAFLGTIADAWPGAVKP